MRASAFPNSERPRERISDLPDRDLISGSSRFISMTSKAESMERPSDLTPTLLLLRQHDRASSLGDCRGNPKSAL